MEFFCFHGVHEAEKIVGNRFLVDLKIEVADPINGPLSMAQTVDYTIAYQIIAEIMQVSEDLLENICLKIIKALKHKFLQVQSLTVKITKLNPPLKGKVHSSWVELKG